MNIRSIRTLVAAGMMAIAAPSTKAVAQSAKTIEKAAQEIVTKDTIKTVKGDVKDARTVLLKKYHGHFDGNVKSGKIADGKLTYTEKGKTILPEKSGKVAISADAGYVNGKDLANGGIRVHGSAQTGNNVFDVTGVWAQKEPKTDWVAKASYTRLFPINQDFALTAKGEAEGVIHRVKGGDSFGEAWPQALVGGQYTHKFDNGMRVAAKAEAGAAFKITEKEHTFHDISSTKFVANAEVEAGMNRTSVFVSGGNDAVMGANVGAGVRVKF